jgi:hypothetical protein
MMSRVPLFLEIRIYLPYKPYVLVIHSWRRRNLWDHSDQGRVLVVNAMEEKP